MNLSPAKSQKAAERPISFILDSRGGAAEEVTLFIRPEEMTRTHPSRATVNQTLGGAWIDSFGEGLESTNISGTLGWRAGPDGKDGGDRLIAMRENTYHRWHKLRQDAVDRGNDPNDVKLRFVDVLNDYSSVIVPLTFEIRRSRSRPLLASYRVSFVAVGKAGMPFDVINLSKFPTLETQGFGLASLFNSIREINAAIDTARNYVNKTVLAPVQDFMRMSRSVFTAVHDTISNGLSLADPFINIANGIAHTGVNVFRTMASIAGIPEQAKAALMQVAGSYSNAFCVLRNSLKRTETYEDYNPLYGASNCSSTGGGRPPSLFADQNPFYSVNVPSFGLVGISPSASAAMFSLMRRDIVVSPLSLSAIGSSLSDMNTGITIR